MASADLTNPFSHGPRKRAPAAQNPPETTGPWTADEVASTLSGEQAVPEPEVLFGPASATTTVDPRLLRLYEGNAREGDVEAIKDSLRVNGQYKPIAGNIGTKTGRPGEILAGNHTLKAFLELADENPQDPRWQGIRVFWCDVDDDKALQIVLADNRTFERGEGTDPEVLVELLGGLTSLAGTGYKQVDLDELIKARGHGDPEPPTPPPGPSLPRSEPVLSFTLQFDTELQQQKWFDFVKWLASRYDDEDYTLAERLAAYIDDESLR